MTGRGYTTVTRSGNRAPWAAAAAILLIVCAPSRADVATAIPSDSSPLAQVAAFLRAHPSASGPVTWVRHVHAHDRTTAERGMLQLAVAGARLSLGAHELALDAETIEAFDGESDPPRVLVLHGETPLAAYAALVAGEDPTTRFRERVLTRQGTRASVEVTPITPWLGLERAVVRLIVSGPDAGRIERCLWLDGLGNWQRLDLEALGFPTRIDPLRLVLGRHPEARRIEM